MVLLQFLAFCVLVKGTEGACSLCGTLSHGYHTVNYQTSGDHIENPGRGFYYHMETHVSPFHPVTIGELDQERKDSGVNIALRVYIIGDYVDSAMSASFLQKIRTDLSVIKAAGWTVVMRFSYINTYHQKPYGDASKRFMLEHIKQLSPIWNDYGEIISAIQAGFIGTWGEWAYSTYFGDANHPDPHGVHGLSQQNWQDRKDILKAILDNSPKTVHVQVRVPLFKTEIWGTGLSTTTRLSDEDGHTYVGRTGHHNDCFLASDTDEGTYDNVSAEKAYLARDSLYVPVGGETCQRSPEKHGVRRSDCPTALKELKLFHWSFLNKGFNHEVMNNWKSQGCYDQIHRDLGYRLSLKSSVLPLTVTRGGSLCFHLIISSTGFAAPYKPWSVRLVLKHTTSGRYYSAVVPNIDVQSWLTGLDHAVDGNLAVPSSLTEGNYQVYLAIYTEELKSLGDYYVMLANAGVPNYAAGLNDLKATIQVKGSSHSSSSGCPSLTAWSPPTPSKYSRVFGSSSGSTGSRGTTSHGSCHTVSVPNHSFENTHDHTWAKYHGGYTYTSSDHHSGSHAISVSDGGAWFTTTFSTPIHKFIMTAYSIRHGSSSRSDASDYSIYCDLKQTDGHYDYGEYTSFNQKSHSWQRAELRVNSAKGITQANCYVLYRHFTDGSALFDDVTFTTLDDNADFSDC